ncbi:hypothetical protein LBMAG42_33960 [Deltaproteobacteria bacterium]|nr:hypothetical protein LBMAG42_33960 [Deltaproteobacteria bacterium]
MRLALKLFVVLAAASPLFLALGADAQPARHPGRNGALSEQEVEFARIAWRYFENNTNGDTCLVNSVDNYPSASMWDTASALGALISAHELQVLADDAFYDRVRCLLVTLRGLELFEGELPNKAYDTRTATMTNYANEPAAVGYSAIDLGRLLIWLRILKEREPYYAPAVNEIVSRWHFCNLLDRCGTLYGAMPQAGAILSLQEGRLGYEEYAAKGFQLWGFRTTAASRVEPVATARVAGVDVPYDARDPRTLGAHNYVVTESYGLDGIELNWDRSDDRSRDDRTHSDATASEFASRIYEAQEARHAQDRILTARTEHQLDVAPWFVYDTIFSDGYPWNTIAEDGRFLPASAAVSTKAAFTLWALWATPYTDLLLASVRDQFDPERGFYEGTYEATGEPIKVFTANNNGVILESLLYKVQGKLLRVGAEEAAPWAAPNASGRCQIPARQRSPCGPAASR